MAVAELDHVSKAYRVGAQAASLRETIGRLGRRIVTGSRPEATSPFWAVRDVTLTVDPGEVLGIIGPNGGGKTTLLKLLSKITFPTVGRVVADTRVASLIELGAGFHPDLTGRENVFLNASILGMSIRDTRARFDAIVSFAGLESFIDVPVKRYSSGMYVRLGFAVAAHIDPRLLLVDEVLAVGDADFRQQSLQRIREMRSRGMAIVFVSHNHYLVESLCDRVLVLTGGRPEFLGPAAPALEAYERWRHEAGPVMGPVGEAPSGEVTLPDVRVHGVDVAGRDLRAETVAEIRVRYRALRPVRRPNLYLKVLDGDGQTCCMVRTSDRAHGLSALLGEGTVTVTLDPIQLTPGTYRISAELLDDPDFVVLAARHSDWFRVAGSRPGHEGVFVPHVAAVTVTPGAGE